MKKLLILLIVVMTGLSTASCGEKVLSEEGPDTIVWYVPGSKQPGTPLVMEELNKIITKKLGVKLDVRFIDTAAYTQRMNMYFASGNDDFDLCFTGYINPFRDTVTKGAYLAIDKYVEESELIKKAIPEYARIASSHLGKLYALPNMQIMATSCTGLFIKESLAQEYGLKAEEIKSLKDIEPFLEWVKNNHPELYPFRTGAMGGGVKKTVNSDSPSPLIYVMPNPDGTYKVQSRADYDWSEEEVRLLRSWFKKGYIRSDNASVLDQSSEQAAGKFAVWRGVYKPGAGVEHNANNPNNRCICIQISDAYMPYDAGSTAMTAINAKSKHPDDAFKIMELVNTDAEVINMLAFGVEGIHYNLDEKGKVVPIGDPDYKPGGAWKFGNVFNTYLYQEHEDGLWEKTIEFNDAARKSSIMGFTFDGINVRTQLAQVNQVAEKYKQGQKGTADYEEWTPLYVKELEEAGIEDIRAEVERQLNEWCKKN